ncbi:RNases MRP/P 32.9 kDa subunit [Spathaspora sp. JA1]|nr:RNases MRP/P 32.9 kDa subunit [Spathaspora sp. JA1]
MNELEKHLLTRCYDSQSKIVELLESRYSTQDQKSSIIFTKSDNSSTSAKLLTHDTATIPKARLQSTRKSLRTYISTTLSNQRKLTHRIKQYNRKKPHKHPFPLDKLLLQYNIPNFQQFIHMNKLWQSYMQDLLMLNSQGNQGLPNILPKLATADYIGCIVKVVQSRNRNCVGISGIVVWDAQHAFILCVPRGEDGDIGGFKVVPKQHTLFTFDVILPKPEKTEKNKKK